MSLKDLQHGEINNSFLFELPNFKENGKLGTFESDIIPGFDVQRLIYIYAVPGKKDRLSVE